jgi:hypothetical protein
MSEPEKFTLPISPSYVHHWSLWEAVREIYQNALDERTLDPSCDAEIACVGDKIIIGTSKGRLDASSLVLGNGTKAGKKNLRGKYGEGYKLALLVLARLGHDVHIANGSERWRPQIERDEKFGSDVLNIYVERDGDCGTGVVFSIRGVKEYQWAEIGHNIRQTPERDEILFDANEQGRIYVGGLYVTTVKEFKYGYSFKPETIRLDRDRGMVSNFDLSWETSKLWMNETGDRVVKLLESEAPDVQYVEEWAEKGSPLVRSHYDYFVGRYGYGAIPVSTQEEVERATAAGVKWVPVKQSVKTILRMVHSFFIPNAKSPIEQLIEFKEKHRYRMTNAMISDLDEIIANMGGERKEEAKAV